MEPGRYFLRHEEQQEEEATMAAAAAAEADDDAGPRSVTDNNDNRNSAAVAVVSPARRRDEETTIRIGLVFYKKFEDGEFYEGRVVSGPEEVTEDGGSKLVRSWRVRYVDDGQEEDLTAAEISEWPGEAPAKKKRARPSSGSGGASSSSSQYEKAKTALLWLPGIREDEAAEALDRIGPPYGLQAAMDRIHAARGDPDNYRRSNSGGEKFVPHVGMKVRKAAGGAQYLGKVTTQGRMMEVDDEGHRLRMWEVTYEDGGKDDLDWYQLLQARADRPVRTHPCRGRQLGCVELFSGCGMVAQEFAERKWLVRSVDNSRRSNASDRVDIMKFELRDIGYVPDRKVETEAKAKNPHLIAVIENPVGLLSKMPLMAELERSLGLYRTTVDYCAFGRSDKKPTHLWTNVSATICFSFLMINTFLKISAHHALYCLATLHRFSGLRPPRHAQRIQVWQPVPVQGRSPSNQRAAAGKPIQRRGHPRGPGGGGGRIRQRQIRVGSNPIHEGGSSLALRRRGRNEQADSYS